MADKFENATFEDIKTLKKNPKSTVGNMVLDIFKKNEAFDEESAIEIAKFKDLNLSTETIGYTIGNYYDIGIIKKTEDDKFYFAEVEFKKFEKKILRKTYMMLAIPAIIAIVFILVVSGGNLAIFG